MKNILNSRSLLQASQEHFIEPESFRGQPTTPIQYNYLRRFDDKHYLYVSKTHPFDKIDASDDVRAKRGNIRTAG